MKKIALTLAAPSITLVSYSAFSAQDGEHVRLATTTSTYHSGL
ncbi:tungsten ABC transporter substrate-binding protein, partial [Vibrio parahaemolyticus]|nr:tungsten ABC transporter substrate-binding protein [Vibrio parahaemolyticus]